MRYRRSLRFRILLSYVAVGGLLAPLLTGLLFAAIYQLEEQLIAEQIEKELAHFIELTQRNPSVTRQESRDLKAYVRMAEQPTVDEPAFVADLAPGEYEVEHDGTEYFCLIADRFGYRYTLIFDITDFERGEAYLVTILITGTVLSLAIAVWFGYWLSHRLIAPVSHLAQQVATLAPERLSTDLADNYSDDEVGDLARAFAVYNRRLHTFLQRERDFPADASHELRNPLAVIQNAAELLLDQADLPQRLRDKVQRIERAACEMSDSLSALLILAREQVTASDQPTGADVVKILDLVLQNQSLSLKRPGIQIETVLQAQPQVAAPDSVVSVLVSNLIRNAFSYTQHGRIVVRLDADRLVIQDTGIGIAEADVKHVFERGFRGGGALGKGNGLGLAIAQRICERYGWLLQIDSQQGSGTRVDWIFKQAQSN